MHKYVLLFAFFAVAFSQTPLTFVPCDPNYDDCIYKTTVAGAVSPGQWQYYSVDLESVDFSTSGDNTTELDFYLYLWENQLSSIGLDFVVGTEYLPSTGNNQHEDSCYQDCSGTYSYTDCTPSKTTWYIGVYNSASTVAVFSIDVYYGSTDGWCDDVSNLFKFIMILILCVVGGVVLIGLLIVLTLCMCCGLSCALCCTSKQRGYVRVDTPANPPHTVTVVQPPVGPYPGPVPTYGAANIQQFPPYNSAQATNANPYYYSNTAPSQV